MDLTSLIGSILGIGAILLGQILEGGNPASLVQITAALIVFGGTIGAVVLSFPQQQLLNAITALQRVYFDQKIDFKEIITELVKYATKARKEGVIALEKEAKNASDPLITLGLEAVADGADPKLVKDLLETQVAQMEEASKGAAKVWETAGGLAPTIGIIGAVLGLIQVMGNLADPSSLGAGIAVAFVATVYGVGFANLFCIPLGTKIKFKDQKSFVAKEMMIEGILSIQAGESPALIERKLNAFILDTEGAPKGGASEKVPA
ncbi:MAG TPA: flagellar motor protein [Candidatus Gastranaerophilales bacterium]|nr:flagellar motor protein [Candidatus Gastranaerophilales bacterium]